MAHGGESGGGKDGRTTTAPPPFDPEQYARDSEVGLEVVRSVEQGVPTKELPPAPPLNKRVRVRVPAADLPWFDLSEAALAFAARIDGATTLHDLLEGGSPATDLAAVAQLHDAGLLVFED